MKCKVCNDKYALDGICDQCVCETNEAMTLFSKVYNNCDYKTLQDCKECVANKYGYKTWRDVDFYPESENAKTFEPPYFKERLHDEAAELYAAQFRTLS